jgi:hypothetical protein
LPGAKPKQFISVHKGIDMKSDYDEIVARIQESRNFVTFQPIKEFGDRLVLASKKYDSGPRIGGLGGNSFWIAKRGKDWYIATWLPAIFRIPDARQVLPACLRLLQKEPPGAYYTLDKELVTEYSLEEITETAFSELE